MTDSLIIAEQIELIGAPGGVASTNPLCPGAKFRLMPGYDQSAPQPTTDIVGSLLLDGERPFGRRASNRTISLPIMIWAPNFYVLAQAREVLLAAVNAQTWTLRWTRDTAGPLAGMTTSMPLIFDCFRAQPTVVKYGGPDQFNRNPISLITLTFQALPYGRSSDPVVVDFQAPIAGKSVPPSPVPIDAFTSVSGTNWSASLLGPTGNSAYWTTGSTGKGAGPATYTRSGLGPLNLAGLSAITFWAGFGSTNYFPRWGLKLAGPVQFGLTLTDGTNTLSMAVSVTVRMSNNSLAPVWQQIGLQIPTTLGPINMAAITGYTLTVSNRQSGDLNYTELYVAGLTAGPPSNAPQVQPVAGAVYSMAGLVGSARTPVSLQLQQQVPTTAQVVQHLTVTGAGNWTAPPALVGTTIRCQVVAAGGKGSTDSGFTGRGGGGAAEYAEEPSLAVTPGRSYSYYIPAGGSTASGAPPQATFAGDSVTVVANSGQNNPNNTTTGAAAGTGSANTIHHPGGAGGAGSSSCGGGGGGAGGPTGAGSAGTAGSSGGAGGAPGSGSGPGGTGGQGRAGSGGQGQLAGGGGAGGCYDQPGGNGAPGEIILTYTVTQGFKTLVVHRPNPDAPTTLTPFVSPSVNDTPNGAIQYPVVSQVPNVNARFGSTYTIVLVNYSWNNPTASRTLTVTVNQYEQAGGVCYSESVSLAVTPSALAGPLVDLGELTLPIQQMPVDNLNGYFTITVASTNTADRFQDVLFLDTMGQTIMVQSPTAYYQYFIDEPPTNMDLGNIMGSMFDRADAVSVLAYATVSGPTPYADPFNNQLLMVYAAEGAPSCEMTYYPRWWIDRVVA